MAATNEILGRPLWQCVDPTHNAGIFSFEKNNVYSFSMVNIKVFDFSCFYFFIFHFVSPLRVPGLPHFEVSSLIGFPLPAEAGFVPVPSGLVRRKRLFQQVDVFLTILLT